MKKTIFVPLLVIILFPLSALAQGTASYSATTPAATVTDPSAASTAQSPVPASGASTVTPAPPVPTPKTAPKTVAPTPVKIPPAIVEPNNPSDLNNPTAAPTNTNYMAIIFGVFAVGLGTALFLKSNSGKKDENKKNLKCANIKKLLEEKLNDLTDLKGQLAEKIKDESIQQIKNITEGTEAGEMLAFIEKRQQEYQKLKELYDTCITTPMRAKKVLIFHGTEGYPEENWFPWLKEMLEAQGAQTFVPQFPTPPIVPAKISEGLDVLKKYEDKIDGNTVLVGHSLGGVFALRILEKLNKPVHAAFFVGTPVGIRPISNYDRDGSFSGFDFDWERIKKNAKHFKVFQSDNDPYVGLENGRELAKNLGVELSLVPNAGHFNKKAGYIKFKELWEKLETLLNK
jgi:predicted alpha/beta hydrolase family esterase